MNWQILGAIDWLSMLWGSDRVCCRESWKLEYIYMTQHMAMQMHGPRFKSPSVLSFCFLHIWWLFENVLPYYITVHSKKFVILKCNWLYNYVNSSWIYIYPIWIEIYWYVDFMNQIRMICSMCSNVPKISKQICYLLSYE